MRALVDTLIASGAPEDMLRAARELEEIAHELRAAASRIADTRRDRARVAERKRRVRAALDAVARAARTGRPEADAIAEAAAAWKIAPAVLARLWKVDRAARARADRDARNLEIMRLARRGYTNREIAGRVGLHARTVGAVIRSALAGPAPTPLPAYRPTTTREEKSP